MEVMCLYIHIVSVKDILSKIFFQERIFEILRNI